MSKPKWAPRHGEWGPVKPEFCAIWHANKDSLQKNGYAARKDDRGQWEVRFVPGTKGAWPPAAKPDPIVVPAGMKASICLRCGHVKLIKTTDQHKDCNMSDPVLEARPSQLK